jgi:Putative Actinobacterial Holin-X, holin superfamily III
MAQTNGESTGELLKQFSQDATTLIRKEVELAKAELTEKGKQAGKGAGMFGGAGLFGLGGGGGGANPLLPLPVPAMDAWIAALIVTAVYGAIAGVLALQGKHKVEEAAPPKPEQTVETLKEDVEWAKRQPESVRR